MGYIKWKERFVFSGTGSPGMEYINYKKRSVYPWPTRERRYWFGTTPNKQPDLRAAPSCAPPDPPPPSTRSRHGMYLLNKRMCTVDQMRDLKKKNWKPFSCFAYMLVLWVDYSIGEYSLMSYTGCSRLPQSKAAAVGEFQEDQWAPIDRVGEFTSAFFFPIDQVKLNPVDYETFW